MAIPTVKAPERVTADLLGKEDAVYMPTGTITAHTEPGDAVLFDQNAHVYLLEGGVPAAFSGVLPRLLPGVWGIFTGPDIEAALGSAHSFFPATIPAPVKLLCPENTHNIGGGGRSGRSLAAGRNIGWTDHLTPNDWRSRFRRAG
jgi:threonine aldolase